MLVFAPPGLPPPVTAALLTHALPVLVSTFPAVPGATPYKAEVPLPITTFPAGIVWRPVPPFPTANVPVAFATGILVVAAMFPDVGLPSAGVIKLGLVRIGLLFITTDPVPVIGLLTSCFVELLNTARDAVRLEMIRFAAVVVLPLNVRFASPPNAPELLY
jgi:hypothetical protein